MLAICFYDAAPINLKAVLNFDKGGRKVVSTNQQTLETFLKMVIEKQSQV